MEDVNQVHFEDSPLTRCAEQGHRLITDALILTGAEVSFARKKDGMTAIMLACQKGHIDVVRSLLTAGADPRAASPSGKTALDFAAPYPEILALLQQ